MGKNAYMGIGGSARKIKQVYIGVDGVARAVKKGYIGIDGIARAFYGGQVYTGGDFVLLDAFDETAAGQLRGVSSCRADENTVFVAMTTSIGALYGLVVKTEGRAITCGTPTLLANLEGTTAAHLCGVEVESFDGTNLIVAYRSTQSFYRMTIAHVQIQGTAVTSVQEIYNAGVALENQPSISLARLRDGTLVSGKMLAVFNTRDSVNYALAVMALQCSGNTVTNGTVTFVSTAQWSGAYPAAGAAGQNTAYAISGDDNFGTLDGPSVRKIVEDNLAISASVVFDDEPNNRVPGLDVLYQHAMILGITDSKYATLGFRASGHVLKLIARTETRAAGSVNMPALYHGNDESASPSDRVYGIYKSETAFGIVYMNTGGAIVYQQGSLGSSSIALGSAWTITSGMNLTDVGRYGIAQTADIPLMAFFPSPDHKLCCAGLLEEV